MLGELIMEALIENTWTRRIILAAILGFILYIDGVRLNPLLFWLALTAVWEGMAWLKAKRG